MRAIAFAIFFIAKIGFAATPTAPTIYRCGSTYSNMPCPEAVVVDTVEAPSGRDKQDADRATARIRQQAQSMEKERLAREKQEAQALKTAQAQRDKATAKKHKKAPGDDANPPN